MALTVVQFPEQAAIRDIPTALRDLADSIEAGNFGAAINLAWVIDQGELGPAVGLLGKATAPGAEAHLLFAIAQHMLVKGCLS